MCRHGGPEVSFSLRPATQALTSGLIIFLLWTIPVEGQIRLQDLVITGGVTAEGYRGNFSAVTVPLVDSTESAAAAVGEFGVRGSFMLHRSPSNSLRLSFDGGLRQFAAVGFQLRDYAPREWAGNMSLDYRRLFENGGSLVLNTAYRGRGVADRPPMPLFLQPGYDTFSGMARLTSKALGDVRFDLGLMGERSDFTAPALVPQLDLLDRTMFGVEVGAGSVGESSLRLTGAYRRYHYPQQGSGYEPDPFRRDHSFQAGLRWTFDRRAESGLFFQLGANGTLNRSNSRRMEYDAVRFSALASTSMGDKSAASLYAALTTKRYLTASSDVRLVPGEEADNASIAYVQLSRALAVNLDGSFRLGWTRAETDIGGAYYRRFGGSFILNFRPLR